MYLHPAWPRAGHQDQEMRNAGAGRVLGVIMCSADKWEVLLLPQTAISSVSMS